jgi:hypothetical protein
MTDVSERERRKVRWETRFAGWLVEKAPFVWTLGKQLVLAFSTSLFLGTGFLALLFGFNILVSFSISIAIALAGLFLYRSRNGSS